MKIIKPLSQGLLYKTFEADNKFYLCCSMLSCFSFNSNSLLSELDLWKFVPAELGKDAIIDQCMPKPNAEALVTGKCFASGGTANAGEVLLKMGGIDKRLYVFGDRFWKKNKLLQLTISDPLPFSEMAISWEKAFGGPEFKTNPLGKGFRPRTSDGGAEEHPLPNVEYPGSLIASINDKPDPACFGPVDMIRPQRMDKAGTYDEKWRRELFPGLARDMDHSYFNTAPSDQWIQGFFSGDEPFEVIGMHPEKREIKSRLPGFKSRCFVNRKTENGAELTEIATVLDTVWLFPHAEKGVFVWRGVTEINTDDAEDVLHMMVAYERLNDEPKTFSHYNDAFVKRIDEKNGYLYAMDEQALIPAGEISALAELAKSQKSENALAANMKVKAEKEKEKAEKKKEDVIKQVRVMAEKAGIDPETIMPKPQPIQIPPELPPMDTDNFDPEAIIKFMKNAEADALQRSEKAMADAMAKKALAEKGIKDVCKKQGLDFEKIMGKLKAEKPKRPIFSSQDTVQKMKGIKDNLENHVKEFCAMKGVDFGTIIAQAQTQSANKSFPMIETVKKMREMDLESPETLKKLQQAEQASKDMYRKTAHRLPKPEPLPAQESSRLREAFLARISRKADFRGQDFAGADLKGLDLKNCDLREIYLEGADLTGADLSGADLSGGILAWAVLAGVKMHKAKMLQTCLGAANCTGAEFCDADLSGCILSKSDLTQATFRGSDLTGTDVMETVFSHTDFSNVKFGGAIFLELDLTGVNFAGADLSKSIFIKPKLDNACFSEAVLTQAGFIEAHCRAASFAKANCAGACFLLKSTLVDADFSQANLENANLMEADLTGASFKGASLNNANLTQSKCKGADLTGSVAKRALCMKTDFEGASIKGGNFMEANLKGARLVKADLSKSNLYGSELFRIKVGDTRFSEANLTMTKLENWRTDDQG